MKLRALLSTFGRRAGRQARTRGRVPRFESLEARLNLSTVTGTSASTDWQVLASPASAQPVYSGGWISLSNSADGTVRQLSLADILGKSLSLDPTKLRPGGSFDQGAGNNSDQTTNSLAIAFYPGISLDTSDSLSGNRFTVIESHGTAVSGLNAGVSFTYTGTTRSSDWGMISIAPPSLGTFQSAPDNLNELGGGTILLNDVYQSQQSLRNAAPAVSDSAWLLDRDALGMSPGPRRTASLTAAQGRDIAFDLAGFSLRSSASSNSTATDESLDLALGSEELGQQDLPARDLSPVTGPEATSGDSRHPVLVPAAERGQERTDQNERTADERAQVPLSATPVDQLPVGDQSSDATDAKQAPPDSQSQTNAWEEQYAAEVDAAFGQWESAEQLPESHLAVRPSERRRADLPEVVAVAGVGLGAAMAIPLRASRQDQPCDSRRTSLKLAGDHPRECPTARMDSRSKWLWRWILGKLW